MTVVPGGFLTVDEAAVRLGYSASGVRALLRDGRLAGERVGGQWLIDPEALAGLDRARPARGRPLDQRLAWAALGLLATGSVPPGLHREERARLRTYLDQPPAGLRTRLRARAVRHRLSVASSRIDAVLGDVRFVIGGPHAAAHHLGRPVPGEGCALYLPASAEEDFYDVSYAVPDAERPNCWLRVVEDRYWPFSCTGRFVWPPVAALDCVEDRSAVAGFEGLWPATAR